MAKFGRALQGLRQERNRAEHEVKRLDEAISVLQGLVGHDSSGRPAHGGRTARTGRPRRRISAAGRRRIAAAQRARWAKQKPEQSSSGRQARKGPRHMSAAARKRIARAQRIRWAQLKAKKKAVRARKMPVQK